MSSGYIDIPVEGGGGGSGTVTSVGLSMPAIFSVAGSPVTSAGTFVVTLATESANRVWSGPASGSAATPTFRLLVGADLPLPAAATLGGVFSKAAVSNNFLTSISSADGSVGQAQPAFSNLSGVAGPAQGGTGIANNASSTLTISGNFATTLTVSATTALTLPTSGTILTTAGVGLVEVFTGFIVAPTDGSYTLDEYAKYAYTINDFSVITSAGTTTAAVKINGTNVTGLSAVSVSSVQSTTSASAANSVSAAQRVTIVLSSSASPENLAFTLKVTRA